MYTLEHALTESIHMHAFQRAKQGDTDKEQEYDGRGIAKLSFLSSLCYVLFLSFVFGPCVCFCVFSCLLLSCLPWFCFSPSSAFCSSLFRLSAFAEAVIVEDRLQKGQVPNSKDEKLKSSQQIPYT